MAWKKESVIQTSTNGVVLESQEEFSRGSMMVNFMYQLDWATGCPGIWLDVILSMSVKVFLGEINIWITRLSKADAPPNGGGPHPVY